MMTRQRRKLYDRILTGWLIGTVIPLVLFVITYWVKFSEMEFSAYIRNLWQMRILLKLLSLCVFPNLAFFLLFYRSKYDMAARGVILATFIYAFAVLIAKLI